VFTKSGLISKSLAEIESAKIFDVKSQKCCLIKNQNFQVEKNQNVWLFFQNYFQILQVSYRTIPLIEPLTAATSASLRQPFHQKMDRGGNQDAVAAWGTRAAKPVPSGLSGVTGWCSDLLRSRLRTLSRCTPQASPRQPLRRRPGGEG